MFIRLLGPTFLLLASLSNHDVIDWATDQLESNRRSFLNSFAVVSASLTTRARAEPLSILPAESAALGEGLLEARVSENLLSSPPYGMERPDVFYPLWFSGTWGVNSITQDVQAPCGLALFGGNTTFQSARSEIGTKLTYESRFLASGETCIADREYNVKSIARAAMGANSVVDVPLVSPNKFTCVVAPMGSPSLLRVDLITLNRRQETISPERFDCSEVVREIVAPVGQSVPSGNRSPILKEIETTSIYTYDKSRDVITCRQRSAAFLLPSQQNPVALKMWEASRGRPVDIRFYDVVYTRI